MNAWMLFEIGINAYQAFLVVYFVRQRFHLARPQMRYAWITGAAICGALSIYLFVDVPFPDTAIFLVPLGYTWFASDEKWYFKIFWNAVLTTVFIGMTNAMANLFLLLTDVSWERIMSETSLRIAFVVSLNIALLVAIFLITRINKRILDVLSWMPLVIFLLMLMIDLSIIEILYVMRARSLSTEASGFFSAASLLLLFSCLLALALYEIMSAGAARQQKMEAELQKNQLLQEHYREIKEIYAYMASYKHDLKHRLDLIQTLLTHDQTQKAEELYGQLAGENQLRFQTGNIAVDALLTVKKLLMDKCGIRFEYQPYPLQELPIDESAFCVILTNLLDNAIEAVERMDDAGGEKVIRLKLARSWDVLFLSCKNPMKPGSVRKVDSRFLSSKKEKTGHGFGIGNVMKTVDEANGQCSFTAQADTFVVEIALPFQKKQSDGKNT